MYEAKSGNSYDNCLLCLRNQDEFPTIVPHYNNLSACYHQHCYMCDKYYKDLTISPIRDAHQMKIFECIYCHLKLCKDLNNKD